MEMPTEIASTIIESENGFLVCDDKSGSAEEVLQIDSVLQCQCFIAQVSSGDCEHVRAVLDYLSATPASADYPVMSQAEADSYLSRIAELDNTVVANEDSAEQQIDRIRLWLEMESVKLDKQRAYYLFALESWMHQQDLSTKTLVNGILKVRAQQPEITIKDEDAVLKDDRFVRIVPEKRAIDKAALRKYVVSTGEEIEGTEVILRRPKFTYKLSQASS